VTVVRSTGAGIVLLHKQYSMRHQIEAQLLVLTMNHFGTMTFWYETIRLKDAKTHQIDANNTFKSIKKFKKRVFQEQYTYKAIKKVEVKYLKFIM